MKHLLAGFVCVALILGGLVSSVVALEPDQILLVVNSNVPDGRKLAESYANARQVPRDHIFALKLPITEEIAFSTYEQDVVPPLRQFLRAAGLDRKITCVVTFYGMPIRVGNHVLTAAEKQEIASLQARQATIMSSVKVKLEQLEAAAVKADPAFSAGTGDDVEHMARRGEFAIRTLAQWTMAAAEGEQRAQRSRILVGAVNDLSGPAGVIRTFASPANTSRQSDEERQKLAQLAARIEESSRQINQLQERRFDPLARAETLKLVQESYGPLDLLRIIQGHLDYLKPEESAAALDSELSLLWWNLYPRNRWQPNLLSYPMEANWPASGQTLMVMRLDAPEVGQVTGMILAGLKAEREGLKGKMVLDSRGIPATGKDALSGSYGWYDQSLRDLLTLLRAKTKQPLLFDDSPEVLPANSVRDVALYCGWYSLHHYIPACQFNPGAVGFHVASLEMISIKNAGDTGWVPGLVRDGVAATLGAVAEPYLAVFPRADDFFPLLLTGKLPLAEVYWRTEPATSWMISMIGDPLYTPYKNNPMLKVEDLPPRLAGIFRAPATAPTTLPAASPIASPATLPAPDGGSAPALDR